jgi:hypothetical protein
MNSEPALREKLARIWSQRRGRYVLLRIRYESSESSGLASIVYLQTVEEID